jgi:hypothetical protein
VLRPIGRRLLVVLVALVSGGVALTAWGSSSHDIGPLRTRLSLVPSLSGGVTVLPPLGRLELLTHAGPLRVSATVTGVDLPRARRLLRSPTPRRTVGGQVAVDSVDALAATAARGALVALLASGVTCAVVFRRPRAVLGGTAIVMLAMASAATVAATTVRTQAFNEPKFDGLLAQAPVLVGRVQDFDAYSERMAELTANVARVYGSLATLPTAPAEDSTRVLWVSDIHNNPQSYTVMRQLVEQFDVDAIVDTGDIVDVVRWRSVCSPASAGSASPTCTSVATTTRARPHRRSSPGSPGRACSTTAKWSRSGACASPGSVTRCFGRTRRSTASVRPMTTRCARPGSDCERLSSKAQLPWTSLWCTTPRSPGR